jgi:hypothetical protein
MPFLVLHGGTRDGESTVVDEHVTRLYAASAAPGLVDIYEATDHTQHVPGNDEAAIVYNFIGQEAVDEMTQIHMPHTSTN